MNFHYAVGFAAQSPKLSTLLEILAPCIRYLFCFVINYRCRRCCCLRFAVKKSYPLVRPFQEGVIIILQRSAVEAVVVFDSKCCLCLPHKAKGPCRRISSGSLRTLRWLCFLKYHSQSASHSKITRKSPSSRTCDQNNINCHFAH